VNRLTVIFLCLMLCLAGTTAPTGVRVSTADTVANRVIVMTLGSKILKVDDADIELDAAPQIKWSRTFSPIAPIINALGGTTDWNAETSRVTTVLGRQTIAVTIGSRYAMVNGKRVSIDSNPDLVPYVQTPGRTMLPLRFIAQQYRALVAWNSTLQRITLTLKVASLPLPLVIKGVASFTTRDTTSTFLTLLGNKFVDVIEMAGGTYHLPCINIDIERTRPVVVRPAAGATVVFSGAHLGGSGQFKIGDHGTAGNITMQGLIFDGYTLGKIGIFHIFNAHDITLNDMVVRNSRANGTSALPYHSWAVYITSTSAVIPTNISVNRWTVDGSARGMSALQVYGGSHITATGWSVANVYYAVYACSDRGPLTNFILDGWTVTNAGSSSTSLYFNAASGRYSNIHTTGSGVLVNLGTPKLTDGGGNSS